ncbi:MAG: hypothetical protein GY749_08070 [Desulfobacteraceae bacterium]|nr:hypothetical protein [Desulfobacteraceae bacterium]
MYELKFPILNPNELQMCRPKIRIEITVENDFESAKFREFMNFLNSEINKAIFIPVDMDEEFEMHKRYPPPWPEEED